MGAESGRRRRPPRHTIRAVSIVLVTGGTGTLGSLAVAKLRDAGHEVRVLSRRPGGGSYQGDLTSGQGVPIAARGVDLVLHAASDTRRLGHHDFVQTRNLLAAAREVNHLLYVSIVGIDRLPFFYYRQKLRCEELIGSSGVPHTILRATQFHELIAIVLRAVEHLPIAPLPLDFQFQPVAAAEVAGNIVGLLDSPPAGRANDMGGPEVLDLGHLAQSWRAQRGRPVRLARLPMPGRVAAGFRHGLNTCPDRAIGREAWVEYLTRLPA